VILFKCTDGTARLYYVPQPLADNPKIVRAWAQAQTGFKADDKGMLGRLSQSEWLASQEELSALEKLP
jgi:hypothetical protein